MTKELLSGNEAIAQGAWEAGVAVGVGYPGTPSTEILERFGKLPNTYAEWAPNEKVALETALGVAMAGRRALFTCKHVGVNVAADPFMTAAYTGVNAGLVMVAADDPGMYSSQNEQDSRNYAAFARVPMLEPSTSQEAIDFTRRAFEVSEEFDTVAMVRTCVRIAHTKSMAETHEQHIPEPRPYEKDPRKWVMMPANAKPRRKVVDARSERLVEFAETCDLTREELRDTSLGIVCSGSVYEHVREALPEASTLKLGLSWPLPPARLAAFASKVEKLYVVEEVCPYYLTNLRALGLPVLDTPCPLPPNGELTPGLIRTAFGVANPPHASLPQGLPPRPPALCPGCPHRLVYAELRRLKATVLGDIGCYTLGALPPLSGLDSTVDMGASISMAHGFDLARRMGDTRSVQGPVVAVIGDSTFAHSGITSLLTITYNMGSGTVCILDNRTTAMTGQQGNPVNGTTLQGRTSRELDLAELCHALGVSNVREVDAMDMEAVRTALKEATSNEDELSVIVFRSPCVLVHRTRKAPFEVNWEKCRACGTCVKLGCPALGKELESGRAHIDPELCIGCGQCIQYCNFGAISPTAHTLGGAR